MNWQNPSSNGKTKLDYTLPVSPPKLKTGDSVFIKDHEARPFDQVYVVDYFIVSIKINKVEFIPPFGVK